MEDDAASIAEAQRLDFGSVKEIVIYKDYKNKIRDSFNDPFEALQELVDNGLAKRDTWNATLVSLDMDKHRILKYEDNGAGMTFSETKEAFQYGHKNALPAGSKYSRYGQGLDNSLVYLFPNSYVLSKSRNAQGEVERSVVVFGDQVEAYTGDCIGTAQLRLPQGFNKRTKGDLIGAVTDMLPQDKKVAAAVLENCDNAFRAIFANGSLLKDLTDVVERFDKMPETGVQIFGRVRDDVPLTAVVNADRPVPEGREDEPNDILNSESSKMLSETIPLWYMPFSGHSLLPQGYVESGSHAQHEVEVNKLRVEWSKHPWTRAVTSGLKPLDAYSVTYDTGKGVVELAMVQAIELSKDSAECWDLWESKKCGFLLYYNSRAIWREPKFPEEKRQDQDTFLRKVQHKSQKNDTQGYGYLRKLVGKLELEHPSKEEYKNLPRGLKHIKYKSALAGQLVMVRVFDDVIHMHDSKVSLRESKEVTFLWDRVYQREIERCWREVVDQPAEDGANQDEIVYEPGSRVNGSAHMAGARDDVGTTSRAHSLNVESNRMLDSEGTSHPRSSRGRMVQRTAKFDPSSNARPVRQRAAPAPKTTPVTRTAGAGKRKRGGGQDQVPQPAFMEELKARVKAMPNKVKSVVDIVESVKVQIPLRTRDELHNALEDLHSFHTWLRDNV